jgi:hypothetical protein
MGREQRTCDSRRMPISRRAVIWSISKTRSQVANLVPNLVPNKGMGRDWRGPTDFTLRVARGTVQGLRGFESLSQPDQFV